MAEAVSGEKSLTPDFEEEAFENALSYDDGDYEDLAYDPLEFIEGEDDEDWEDQTEPMLPEALPPETPLRRPTMVYSLERAGSVRKALGKLVTTNVSRRLILLAILDWSRDGIPSSELFEKIEELQKDNLSVYAPVSYCRMLERTGALVLEFPEKAEESEPEEGADLADGELAERADAAADDATLAGVTYLSIEEDTLDPIWRATEEGLEAYEELSRGDEWRQKILVEDERYAEIYLAVMNRLLEGGCNKADLIPIAEAFEARKKPLKLGNYFIDVLESTFAIRWHNSQWELTDLGRQLLPELEELCEQRKADAVTSEEDSTDGK